MAIFSTRKWNRALEWLLMTIGPPSQLYNQSSCYLPAHEELYYWVATRLVRLVRVQAL